MDYNFEILITQGDGNIHRMSTNSWSSANYWFFQYKEKFPAHSIGLYHRNELVKRYHPWCGIYNCIQKRSYDHEEYPSQINCAHEA